jgi:hypothetical protein
MTNTCATTETAPLQCSRHGHSATFALPRGTHRSADPPIPAIKNRSDRSSRPRRSAAAPEPATADVFTKRGYKMHPPGISACLAPDATPADSQKSAPYLSAESREDPRVAFNLPPGSTARDGRSTIALTDEGNALSEPRASVAGLRSCRCPTRRCSPHPFGLNRRRLKGNSHARSSD